MSETSVNFNPFSFLQMRNNSYFQQLIVMNTDCIGCQIPFSTLKVPKKLRNCNHNLCQKCLISLTACPQDNIKIQLRRYTMKGFETNQQILNSLQNSSPSTGSNNNIQKKQSSIPRIEETQVPPPHSSKSILSQKSVNTQNKVPPAQRSRNSFKLEKEEPKETQTCLLHDKIADVLCLDCNEQICSSCALFGDHKGHQVDNLQNFIGKLAALNECSIGLLKQVKQKEDCLNAAVVEEYITDSLNEQKKNIVKNIRQFSTKLIDRIRKAQKNAIAELDKTISQKKAELLSKIQFKELQEKTKEFYDQVNKLSDLMKSINVQKSITSAFKYFKQQFEESYVAKNGEYLKIQYTTLENMHKSLIDNQVRNIIPILDQNFLEKIDYVFNINKEKSILFSLSPNNITHIQSNTKITTPIGPNTSKNQRPTNEDDDILLEAMNEFDHTVNQSIQQFSLESNGIVDSTIMRSIQMNKLCISSSVIGQTSKTSINDKQDKTNARKEENSLIPVTNLNTSRTEKNVESSLVQNKKKKKIIQIPIPAKYKEVFEELKYDRCEVIDFAGAQLGDSILIQLCQLINRTKKVKNVKLLKNKLTDDCISSLLKACIGTNISSLNLAHNFLTQKTLEYIESSDLGQLKNITLNFNKINRKNVKSKLDVLLKKNTIVSL